MTINETVLMGRMIHDINLNTTQNNTPVCTFKIAVDRDYKGNDGKPVTDFIPIVAWKERAEFAAKYFRKGQRVIIVGQIQSRYYQDKEGNRKTSIEVEARKIRFADLKKDQQPAQPQQPTSSFAADEDSTGLPFDL